MNTYFTIGELAQFSHLSKQTLIYYDKEGVFKPSYVDEKNGYRYYSADQIEVLDSLLILKEIGLSLQEIKDFMTNRNSENAVALLKKQHSGILNSIANLKLISKRLEKKINTLEHFYSHTQNSIMIKKLDTEWLAVEPVAPPNGQLEVDLALKSLLNKAAQHHYPHFYQIGDMVSSENIQKGNYSCFSYAFLPLEQPFQKAMLHKKPKGIFACCYHTGPYAELGNTYQKLITDIRKQGFQSIGYAYEFCILDSLTTRNKQDYITELQIQVE